MAQQHHHLDQRYHHHIVVGDVINNIVGVPLIINLLNVTRIIIGVQNLCSQSIPKHINAPFMSDCILQSPKNHYACVLSLVESEATVLCH